MTEAVFMSIPKCAEKIGVSKDFIYTLCHTKQVEFIKVGKKFLIHYPHLLEYLESEAKKGITINERN